MKCLDQPLVLVDIETTGLSPAGCRIIEIACIRIERGQETARFVSFVDPEQPLPKSIQAITGIGSGHLKDAPTFFQIAEEVEVICDGAIFVAHNVRFDYSFIKAEMARVGKKFQKKLLCTVKLSRSLFPEYPKHDLSSLIERFHFTCTNRHRALGDAEVLCQFLGYVEKKFSSSLLLDSVGLLLKNPSLPPNLDPAYMVGIPDAPGVYTFFGKAGEILYIGKSKHLRARIMSHFANTHREGKEMRLWQETASLEYTETVSDLGASLLELYKIKTEAPILNRLSRRTQAFWLLKKKTFGKYIAFELEKCATIDCAELETLYAIFRTKNQARATLTELCYKNALCPKLMGLEKKGGECFSRQLEKCSGACIEKPEAKAYNALVESIFVARKIALWPNKTPKTLRFYNEESGKAEVFVIDNWILKEASVFEEEDRRNLFPIGGEGTFFDYEVYKVLLRHFLPKLSPF